MMPTLSRSQLIKLALALPGAFEDYPFNADGDDTLWCTIRHQRTRKIFALIYERNHTLCINLKCDPPTAEALRESWECIQPGFHMNKKHWITVLMDGSLNLHQVATLIERSYQLTATPKITPGPLDFDQATA